ncbi:hypothetical protein LCGC14_1634990 [marine sediment metagenome]|uniref:Uncharacterized protein n=1 Tax=marine sediment metagenome TaxID=412755 RepID=A0A0F9I1P7_9ZZZZ|nr:hypothetical protein [archaeon]
MRISGDYEKILEDNLKDELEWLEEEFKLLFKDKKNYSKDDILIGNIILDKLTNNARSNDSEEVLNMLAVTLNRIEQTYPAFF